MQSVAREQGAPAIAEMMLPRLLGETTRATRPAVVERVRSLVLANSTESIVGALNAMMSRPDSTPLPTIHCPDARHRGRGGHGHAAAAQRNDAARHRGCAALTVIEGAGHVSSVERPDVFNETVAAFLSHRV